MKIKRTYNLSSDTVAAVKRLVEEEHRAPSQDALVEQAIREYARLLQDAADAALWAQAADSSSHVHSNTSPYTYNQGAHPA
jgi:hypothetical protein